MTISPIQPREMPTFRDPAGSVLRSGNRILRAVNETGRKPLEGFLRTRTAINLHARGNLVSTSEITVDSSTGDLLSLMRSLDGECAIYEHSPVWFPSYPYEWAPEMLYSAAALTLEIAQAAIEEDFGLKDATPFNVLFDNGKPVFVDLCSFEKRSAGDPIWLAYGQFERMFLLPLLASRSFGLEPESIFSSNLDGLDANKLSRWFRFPQNFHPRVLKMVLLPKLLNRLAESKTVRSLSGNVATQLRNDNGKQMLRASFQGLERKLRSLKPVARKSVWSRYDPVLDDVVIKSELTTRVLRANRPETVLDVGCNRGTYSRIAAKLGARVVSIDSDSTVVGQVWKEAAAEGLNVLPLVGNFARPSPGLGWRNAEYLSFEQRAYGKFDAVLMLAVLHHIVVQDRIPLEQILETAASYTRRCLIIEFVANNDPMFQRIAAGRESLFEQHTEERFLDAAAGYFRLVERKPLPGGTRCLFVMHRR